MQNVNFKLCLVSNLVALVKSNATENYFAIRCLSIIVMFC